MEGGVNPADIGWLTFKEVDWAIERARREVEDGWDYTRHIIGAWAGKNPRSIMRLSRDPKPKKWTKDSAEEVIRKFNGRDRKNKR